jgi:hypothetical protein
VRGFGDSTGPRPAQLNSASELAKEPFIRDEGFYGKAHDAAVEEGFRPSGYSYETSELNLPFFICTNGQPA